MKKILILSVLLGASIFGFFGVASAVTFSAADIKSDFDSNTSPLITVSASPGSLQLKTLDGFTGVGTASTPVPGEIDIGIDEWLRIDFASPVSLQEITLGTLFHSPWYGDQVSEKAQIQSDIGTVTLQVTGDLAAVYSGVGSIITNLSPSKEPNGGVWQITNPFAGSPVNYIIFTALDAGLGGPSAANSDFDVVSVTTTTSAVPEPATLLFLGFGVIGLGVAGRRKFGK